MTTKPYNYELIVQHPKLLAFYSGWLGQKICYMTHAAVIDNRPDFWFAAAAEVDRLVLILHCAVKAGRFKLPRETRAVLGEFVGHYADGDWWISDVGRRERAAHNRERQEGENPGDVSFHPWLLLEHDREYSVAATLLKLLGEALMQAAVVMEALGVCRMGVLLAGFCYRLTPRLDAWFINSIFNDLAAYGMTDRQAVNEFKRTLGLKDVPAGHDEGDLCESYVGNMTNYRNLVLACIFRHFDVMLPPAESDVSHYPELAGLKKKLRASLAKATKSFSSGTRGGCLRNDAGGSDGHLWIDDVIAYLGVDQLGVNSQKFVYRLIKKGALPAKKINGRFVFFKADLDRMIANGDHRRTRGRPRKPPSA
ncbi:MAG: helix-turn-helix domain-containing protein [Phycisphaerae bacterium]|jgi:hypothetical protein|nr:helix-turn-helix domain-containing protein [Phycisphaerae bacterium]